jgi:RNA polymerase sigma-70 factor (ECF subfamily)
MTEQNTEDRASLATSRVVLDPGSSADVDRMTDEELLLEYRLTGSSAVFEALVKRYERELYNYLRRFLNNQVLAEDAFQATFMQVHLSATCSTRIGRCGLGFTR